MLKTKWVLLLMCTFLFGCANVHAQMPNPSTTKPFYKIVTFEVPADKFDSFVKLCQTNAESSRKESGITTFEVIKTDGAPNSVTLVEIYKDESDSQAHQLTAHYLAFKKAIEPLGAKRTAVSGTRY